VSAVSPRHAMPDAPDPEFDAFADRYDEALQRGLDASGESKEYFAEGRALWTRRRLDALGRRAGRVLDFGCGTGSATPYLLGALGAREVVGSDTSLASLEVARRDWSGRPARFVAPADVAGLAPFDTAFCNGVFHHIPLAERAGAVAAVRDALAPGGLFAFWENNPWNPGTRWVMSRIEFDRDAITLSPPEARRLLRAGGFDVLRTDSLFWFPRALAALRPLEPLLAGIPLGGQYLVLCRRR
jgi:SAM-dependent methyltransferase